MVWYDKLLTGRHAGRRRKRIIADLESGKHIPGVYLITLAQNPDELLDIIPALMVNTPWFHSDDLLVLGLAAGRKEALSLVRDMVDTVYQATGSFDMKQYYLGQEASD